jgi:transcriptional regulator with XRE-family HTH domain
MIVRLSEWREQRGLSLRSLARRAGVTWSTVHRIETGRLSPTVDMLEKLATALDIDVRDFFAPANYRRRPPRRKA